MSATISSRLGFCRDTGKENGNYYIVYRGYVGLGPGTTHRCKAL